jgi:hypothetical protein
MKNPIDWNEEYIVAITRGRKTKYFYGQTLKEACSAAAIKNGEAFAYAKFELAGQVEWAEKVGNRINKAG